MRESIIDCDLSERIRQIQQEEGRINRGPAGNPTPWAPPQQGLTNPDFCGNCGTHLAAGMPHSPTCPKYEPGYDDYCCGYADDLAVATADRLLGGFTIEDCDLIERGLG